MGPTLVFRSTYGRVLTVATAAVAVALGVTTAQTEDAGAVLRAVLPALAVTAVIWLCFWAPSVTVSDGGVEVRNVTSTVHVPWTAYRGADTRFSLDVRYDGGHVVAWAAPRSSGTGHWLRSSRRRGAGERTVTGASAEAVAAAVTERRAALAAAGHLDRPRTDAPGARRTWHVRELAVVGVLVAASAAALLG